MSNTSTPNMMDAESADTLSQVKRSIDMRQCCRRAWELELFHCLTRVACGEEWIGPGDWGKSRASFPRLGLSTPLSPTKTLSGEMDK
jgi:hypothetical protein